MASSSNSTKVCFNSTCKEALELPRQGWLRRTGEFADLCDRCASAFKDGKFCDTYHLSASGWRCCESCGKQIHCGCIVSFHMFVLLDAGGIECINCAKTEYLLTPNPAWPSASRFLPLPAGRIRDISARNWSSLAGTGPVPWRQAPCLFNASKGQLDLLPRTPFDFDLPCSIDKFPVRDQLSASSLDKGMVEDPSERSVNESLQIDASRMVGHSTTGFQYDEQRNLFGNVSHQSSFYANELATPLSSLPPTFGAREKVSGMHVQCPTPLQSAGKKFSSNNGLDSSTEVQARNGKSRCETRGRNQLVPRYWPRITDQELQQMCGDSNAKITPLFEKVLSASDAGRIGRLVLPKKCAEAYLPPISQPEGLPLVVKDSKGKEWVLQFRFWPNNNSRMYVLEGVNPCIQSMQLQAGDTVTFSRLEPEGKLVMGFRKASTASPANQGNETTITSYGVSTHEDPSTHCVSRSSTTLTMYSPIIQGKSTDPASAWSEVDKSAYIAKEMLGAKVSIHTKRKKGGKMGLNCKRIKHDRGETLQLNVTLEQVQGFLRPPPSIVPSVVLIEGFEIEDFQEAPITGRPTFFSPNLMGENIQWAQCEDCMKWRKVPTNALLPTRWTCLENSWDPERSSCSAEEELTPEQLENMIHQASLKKTSKQLETVEGLDALPDMAIEDRKAIPATSLAATRHPRHRPGCSCIICIQPPSSSKHKSTCTCNVCLMMKRWAQTSTLHLGQQESMKGAENAHQKPTQLPYGGFLQYPAIGNGSLNHKMGDEDPNREQPSTTSFKSQNIDLNIQPEREEESSPVSDSMGMMRLVQESTQRYVKQQKLTISGVTIGNCESGMPLNRNHENTTL